MTVERTIYPRVQQVLASIDEMAQRRDKLFKTLDAKNLKIKLSTGVFATNMLIFAGYCLTDKETHPDQSKVQSVSNAKTPANDTDVKSFLGLANFCSQSIKEVLTEPLRQLTRKREPHSKNIKNKIPEYIPEQSQENKIDRKDREMKVKMKDKQIT